MLRAGEMSLHHVNIIHGSNPNPSDGSRIGFAPRYTTPRTRQVDGEPPTAVLARGRDTYGHFRLLPAPPAASFEEAVAAQQAAAGRFLGRSGRRAGTTRRTATRAREMLTRIDHVAIAVPRLEQGIDAFTRLGFAVHPGGAHPGRGTENAIAFFGEDYLELVSVRDAESHLASPDLTAFLARGGGLRYIVVQSDDLAADVRAMRDRGVDVCDADRRRAPHAGRPRAPLADGALGPANPLPLVFIQHLTPLDARRRAAPGAGEHPNGVLRTERAYVAVPDVARAAEIYARVLGMPVPHVERGAVIKADMAVFPLGPTGLGVAQPAEPGPAADAMARRGPGPFQVLYRTRSMDAAARAMAAHGVPPPVRGVRNTGRAGDAGPAGRGLRRLRRLRGAGLSETPEDRGGEHLGPGLDRLVTYAGHADDARVGERPAHEADARDTERLGALLAREQHGRERQPVEPRRVEPVLRHGAYLAWQRVGGGDERRPGPACAQRRQLGGRQPDHLGHHRLDHPIAIACREGRFDPADEARRDGEAERWLVEEERPQVVGAERRLEGADRAVRVPEQRDRPGDRVDDRGDVFSLAVDRVPGGIAALPASAPVDRVDGEARRERREHGPPIRVIRDRAVHEDQGRPVSRSLVRDRGPVLGDHARQARPRGGLGVDGLMHVRASSVST